MKVISFFVSTALSALLFWGGWHLISELFGPYEVLGYWWCFLICAIARLFLKEGLDIDVPLLTSVDINFDSDGGSSSWGDSDSGSDSSD